MNLARQYAASARALSSFRTSTSPHIKHPTIHPSTQRRPDRACTNAPNYTPLFLHQRSNNGQQDQQYRRTTANRLTRTRRAALHRRHARMGTPSDRRGARVPRVASQHRHGHAHAWRHSRTCPRGGRMAGRAYGCRRSGIVWPAARESAANGPRTGKWPKCVQGVAATPLLRTDDGAHARFARTAGHHTQGVRCIRPPKIIFLISKI